MAFSFESVDGFSWEFQLVEIMFSKEAVSVSMTPRVARWIEDGMPGLDKRRGFVKVSRRGIGPPHERFMGELVIEAIERVIERAIEIEAGD